MGELKAHFQLIDKYPLSHGFIFFPKYGLAFHIYSKVSGRLAVEFVLKTNMAEAEEADELLEKIEESEMPDTLPIMIVEIHEIGNIVDAGIIITSLRRSSSLN